MTDGAGEVLIDVEVVLHLEGRAASVPLARRTVQSWLVQRGVPEPTVERARLVVTELVDNAVRHARTPFEVRVVTDGEIVRVEVTDGSPVVPVVNEPAPDALSGRGVWLVSRLAARWGVERRRAGKVVWAALDLPADAPKVQHAEASGGRAADTGGARPRSCGGPAGPGDHVLGAGPQ